MDGFYDCLCVLSGKFMRFCGIYYSAVTDPNTDNHRSCDCLAGLECLLNLIRDLMMGSCFSTESRSPPPGSPTDSVGIKKRRSFKKRGSRNSSVDDSIEEGLHRIPGRMFLNGSSEVASMFTQQGKKGTNQDAMIVWENFGSRSDTIFCGVFDGHGPHGHLVAKRVRDSLPLRLSAHWEVTKKDDDVLKEISQNRADIISSDNTALLGAEEESTVSVDAVKDPDTFQTVKETFLKAFKVIDRELKFYTNINSFCSGTTAVTLVKQGQDLVIGNVGDSRAILATKDEHNALIAVQLTVDLKPNLPAEAERIRKCKGRVFALLDEPDVARVWLPNVDSPGLAMARAFGDFCLKDFGLISVPEISRRCLTEKDEFVVLASDGIWDVLSNQEVVDIVASSPTRTSTARKVVESAVKAWRSKYPTSKVDDCAVICLFLDSNVSTSLSTSSIAKSNEASTEDHRSDTVEFNKRGVLEEDDEEEETKEEEEALENEEMNSEHNHEWSALVGVARVNTLVTLPRFVPSKEDKRVAADLKKRK